MAKLALLVKEPIEVNDRANVQKKCAPGEKPKPITLLGFVAYIGRLKRMKAEDMARQACKEVLGRDDVPTQVEEPKRSIVWVRPHIIERGIPEWDQVELVGVAV